MVLCDTDCLGNHNYLDYTCGESPTMHISTNQELAVRSECLYITTATSCILHLRFWGAVREGGREWGECCDNHTRVQPTPWELRQDREWLVFWSLCETWKSLVTTVLMLDLWLCYITMHNNERNPPLTGFCRIAPWCYWTSV